ncbi:MAG: MBL fold metallo-hydrolase [Candidatus Norongarragalinales archaeon]
MNVTYIGHSSFLVEMGPRTILIDPWLDSKPRQLERLIPPALAPNQITKCDLILLTHEHFDHCDPYSVGVIQSRTLAQVVAPEETLALLDVPARSRVPVQEGDSFTLMGTQISVTPAKHPQSVYPVGYIIGVGRETLYHAGDTYDFYDLASVDVKTALVPIGGTFTMDIIGAVTSLKRMRAKNAIPMHYNTFDRIKASAEDFARRVSISTKTNPVVLKVGETVSL